MSIKRVLVANRGEIAVRIMRACREMNIAPLAVYSEADANAPFVALADAAECIGPAPAAQSYLNIPALLTAAQRLNADAVHPGYGFLSENADFAEACANTGLIFIGPPADVIRKLGDKSAAKRIMQASGVPVVPGYNGEQDLRVLQAEAAKIGVPLLIKAAAGGGGRGMRVVQNLSDFAAQLSEAQREAQAAFGDSRVLLERYITRPRHVEFQIFGDTHGNLVHLMERECSIQRRHQKIIEEAPAPVMTAELRERMAGAAVAAGKAAGYVNAGTVEFLVEEKPDGSHEFYFLEVNTRLQVEHPVTELITGLDLVQTQIRVANGEPLPFAQEDIQAHGWAMEARIYAEDAATGFLPSVGTLAVWHEPSGPGVRIDSGVTTGSEVSPYYDPMLAKIIAHGTTRAQATARLEQALLGLAALGVTTNTPYLLAILRDTEFRAGHLRTNFLAERFAGWKPDAIPPPDVILALAAEISLGSAPSDTRHPTPDTRRIEPDTLWHTTTGWRNA